MKLFILLLIAFSFSAHALEYNDVLPKVNVIKTYKNNFLVLNRGLEDGIYKGDHIKLTNINGYIARAICIKASMLLSHWKVYRVVHPELLSYDDNYKLRSMNQSEIPDDLKYYKAADFSSEFNDISDKNIKKPINMQQERLVSFDLSNDVKNDPIFKEANKSDAERFVDKNFDADQFAKDFSNLNISFFTSPISWQTFNDQRTINYGVSLGNMGQKYEFSFNLNKTESKVVDQYTKSEITSESTYANIVFDINHITENFTYFMFASYNQARTGKTYYPRRQIQGGLVGLKYHIIDNDETIKKFDISYITLIDYIEYDSEEFNEDTFEYENVLVKERNARHSFRVRLKAQLSDTVFFDSVLWYKPLMYLKNQQMDWENNQNNWTTNLSWSITEQFQASFQYKYTYDIRKKRQFENDPMNQTTTINLSYSFNL